MTRFRPVAIVYFIVLLLFHGSVSAGTGKQERLTAIETRINNLSPNPEFRDDIYAIMVVKQAMISLKEGSGGIGACLVNSLTGKVIETGRNRQLTPHFRSDLHGEMDLLNRYENKVCKTLKKGENPRECKNLILISSVEPCPMCLTRIINSGIKTMFYVVPDKTGGMVTRIKSMPPFWQEFAADRDFREADCSSAIKAVALDLFNFGSRAFAKNRKKTRGK